MRYRTRESDSCLCSVLPRGILTDRKCMCREWLMEDVSLSYLVKGARGKIFGIKSQLVVKSVYIQAPINYFLIIVSYFIELK